MKSILKKLRNIKAENCISIVLNTNRNMPDYFKDEIALKNLLKETAERLELKINKKAAKDHIETIRNFTESIDHSRNLESLLIFVNVEEGIFEYTRLSINVEDRIIIDNTFAVRDIIRSLHLATNYLILVLSRERTRLIEALNDKVLKEYGTPFPIQNKQIFAKNQYESGNSSKRSNWTTEYFKDVDNELFKNNKERELPILICSVEDNFHEFLKSTNNKTRVFDISLNYDRKADSSKALAIEAWKIVKKIILKKKESRKNELLHAFRDNTLLSDPNEIWRAINEGRIQTLFIEETRFQSAAMTQERITFVNRDDKHIINFVDDIYEEMIEVNSDFGGEVVFLPNGGLKEFNGLVAVTRY